jgi:cellulose synthase/poly-beta-1,6-N-acetylglucosamine synthase-like glycosyltransferase
MYLNNLLRNRAKDNLGLSARLMGDAMCFAAAVIQAHGWAAESLGEDREYGLYLSRHGLRIRYLPDARSYGQAAPDWRSATSQRQRWVGGDLQIKRRYLAIVFRQLLARPTWLLCDQLAEFLLPNYSLAILLVALSLLGALAASVSGVLLVFFVATLLFWFAFPLLGLLIAQAPAPYCRVLLQGPRYVIWRLFVTLRAMVRSKRIEWVRTRRSEEKP